MNKNAVFSLWDDFDVAAAVWRLTASAFPCLTSHYAEFKPAVLFVTGLAGQLKGNLNWQFFKNEIRQCNPVQNRGQWEFQTELHFFSSANPPQIAVS